MRRVIVLLTLTLLFVFPDLKAQQCGTEATAENISFLKSLEQRAKHNASDRLAGVFVTVPIKLHIIRRSDGTGGISEGAVSTAVTKMNTFYANANMAFELVGGVNYIDNSRFYDFINTDEEALARPNDVNGAVNLYLSNSITSSSGRPIGGYTRFPPSADRVFAIFRSLAGGTLEHEMGHYFTLFHTHGVTNNGAATGTITFTVPSNAPDTLFYVCEFHASMTGQINIVD